MARSPSLRRAALALLILGTVLAGRGAWIPVKARVAGRAAAPAAGMGRDPG
jgi:hypothetical protein